MVSGLKLKREKWKLSQMHSLIFDFFSRYFRQVTLGNRKKLSNIDIQQMNLLYKCSRAEGGGGGGGGVGPRPTPPTGLVALINAILH